MLKTSELCIAEIPLRVRLGRICLELMTFMFMQAYSVISYPVFHRRNDRKRKEYSLCLGRFCDIGMRCHSCISVLFF